MADDSNKSVKKMDADRGQTIVTSYGRDHSDDFGMTAEAQMGKKMPGSASDISSQISGGKVPKI
jgi:hypothetical protein